MQKRRHSLLEALANTFSGFLVSLATAAYVFPLFGFHSTMKENISITLIFTIISIIRSYAWRRLFVWLHANSWL